jgi:hypothetical protein
MIPIMLTRSSVCFVICLLCVGLSVVSGSVFVNKTLHLSSPRTSFGSVQINDKIYFAGGFDYHDWVPSKTVDVLDLTTGSWSQLNLTSPRGMITPIAIEPRIYFIGGFEHVNIPKVLNLVPGLPSNWTFSSRNWTSGQTVRRPIALSLHGTTLTVIGAYSVDFMDTTNGAWTHNVKLTAVMIQLYQTSTFAHLNNIFVVGGYDMTTDEWSSSIWMINSSSSEPTEFKNKAPEKEVGSFTPDTNNQAVVFQYSYTVMVFHIPTQRWFSRNETNFVSSVSYHNSTVVSFSSGYWTINWSTSHDTWTPVNLLSFAFAVADQFVFSTFDTAWKYVVHPSDVKTLPSVLGGATIQLSTLVSPSVISFVASGIVFGYDAPTRLFTTFSAPARSQPQRLFLVNSTTVAMTSGASPNYAIDVINLGSSIVNSKSLAFLPVALIDGTFIDFVTESVITVDLVEGKMASNPFTANIVFTQEGSSFFAMATYASEFTPAQTVQYGYMDIYNFVDEKWETRVKIDGSLLHIGYHQAMVLNGTLVLFSPGRVFTLREDQSGFEQQPTIFKFLLQNNPTFTPIPVIDGTAYCVYPENGMNVVSWPLNISFIEYDSTAVTRFIIPHRPTKTLYIATTQEITGPQKNEKIFYYDIEADHFESTFIAETSKLSLIMYDDFLLAFGDNTSTIDCYDTLNNQWSLEPFDNNFVPAVLQSLYADNSSTLLMIAGGEHRNRYYFSDIVQFLVLDFTPEPGAVPLSIPTATDPGVPVASSDSNTIVIAAVVPVGVVAIAGALLAVFLTRRNKKRKARTTTNELENRYGQWFTPFSEIQFGAQIGQGANGQVFEGTWKGTKVALKVSPAQANSGVISELEVMINMRPHPNVIQLFGFSVHPETNSVILIIEFCNGGSLDGILYETQPEPISFEQQLSWLQGAAKGLNHLHSNNIVHRDVAARNILLHQNEPKLTDFGMSRFVEEDQKGTTRSELGPIRWMSPESLKNKQYSNKSGTSRF